MKIQRNILIILSLITIALVSLTIIGLLHPQIVVADGGIIVTPMNVDFGEQVVGNVATRTVMITSTTRVVITPTMSGSPFDLIGNNCPRPLLTNTLCTLTVTYTADQLGLQTGRLTVTTHLTDEVNTVDLMGTGVAGKPVLVVTPTEAIDFGAVRFGDTSTSTVTLTNDGTAALTVTAITLVFDEDAYTQTNNCDQLLPKASCLIVITYSPTKQDIEKDVLEIKTNIDSQNITLSGQGVAATLVISPMSLDFGTTRVNTIQTRTLALTNTGRISLSVSDISVSSLPFTKRGQCTVLDVGQGCSLVVTFSPSQPITYNGQLTISSNALATTTVVSLSGKGGQPDAVMTPTLLTFGIQTVGTTSEPQNVILTNQGSYTLTISNTTVTTANFAVVQDNCANTTLAVNASCLVTVRFTPQVAGSQSGQLELATDSVTPIQPVSLRGQGRAQVYIPVLIKQPPPPTPTPTLTPKPTATATPITPLVNGSFDNGLTGWSKEQGGYNGNGSGMAPSTTNNALLLGNPNATNRSIKVGYSSVNQTFTVNRRYLKIEYRMTTFDVAFGRRGYFDTLEISINAAPPAITNNQRDTLGCRNTGLNPAGTVSTSSGLVACVGRPEGGKVDTQSDIGPSTIYLDLNSFQNQNIVLHLALWQRDYQEFVNDRGLFNTYATIDNIELTDNIARNHTPSRLMIPEPNYRGGPIPVEVIDGR